jgi:hypothetical protein
MKRILFDPARLTAEQRAWFHAWEADASAARETLLAGDANDHTFVEDIWGQLKRWLLREVFYGKCAYCEGVFDAQHPGHGEHWRPKGGVKDLNGNIITDDQGVPHPGYWWLAYEWRNLVPACHFCNSGHGKGNRFPVAGQYAFRRDNAESWESLNDLEIPLLIHPYFDRPEDHLSFDEFGSVRPRTERGDASIQVYDLRRGRLNEERLALLQKAKGAVQVAIGDRARGGPPVWEAMTAWIDERATYSAAVVQLVTSTLVEVIEDLEREARTRPAT